MIIIYDVNLEKFFKDGSWRSFKLLCIWNIYGSNTLLQHLSVNIWYGKETLCIHQVKLNLQLHGFLNSGWLLICIVTLRLDKHFVYGVMEYMDISRCWKTFYCKQKVYEPFLALLMFMFVGLNILSSLVSIITLD